MPFALDPRQSSFLHNLSRIQERSERAQRTLASGLRMATASDDPDRIGVLLQSRAELASAEQTKSNLNRVRTEVDAAENAVQNGIKVVERVRVLAAQASSGTQSAATKRMIASEVESLHRQLVGIANTAIDGRYIFAGSADQAPPYVVDLNTATGATIYAGGNATRQIRDASGVRFSIGRTGQELFDNPTAASNAFRVVKSVRDALLANDDVALQTGLADLGTALDHLNEQLGYYGTAQNSIAEAASFADKKILSLTAEIAETEGADLAQTILEMQDANTHRQAALQAKAQEDRRTVFDFIR
ncbi:MAG: hypothetical protein FJW38_24275 [Acidobacteria bacterium]|nr:hypothetical protein [Acidobacteriota bacterium]